MATLVAVVGFAPGLIAGYYIGKIYAFQFYNISEIHFLNWITSGFYLKIMNEMLPEFLHQLSAVMIAIFIGVKLIKGSDVTLVCYAIGSIVVLISAIILVYHFTLVGDHEDTFILISSIAGSIVGLVASINFIEPRSSKPVN